MMTICPLLPRPMKCIGTFYSLAVALIGFKKLLFYSRQNVCTERKMRWCQVYDVIYMFIKQKMV